MTKPATARQRPPAARKAAPAGVRQRPATPAPAPTLPPPTHNGAPTRSGGLPYTAEHPLASWRRLNEVLTTLTEERAWALYEEEKQGRCRVQLILRLYGRANKLRAQRERRAGI